MSDIEKPENVEENVQADEAKTNTSKKAFEKVKSVKEKVQNFREKAQNFKEKIKANKIKIGVCSVIIFFVLCTILALSVSVSDLGENNTKLTAQVRDLKEKNTKLNSKVKKLTKENESLQAKVDEAAPWFEQKAAEEKAAKEKAEAEKKAAEEEAARKAAEEKAAREKEEAEKKAAEKAAKEEEERLSYETGITFEQLARTPDEYEGKKVKFSGKVIQVLEDGSSTNLRIAIDSDYDKVILVDYFSSIVSSRVLEDDIITIYGVSKGLYTYKSVLGGSITVPLIRVNKIDM